MKPHKHEKLIKQWAEGAEIEVRGEEEWFDASNPTFRSALYYRVKPKNEKIEELEL